MTEITEEILSGYSELNINAAAVLLSDQASVLLSRYSVKINTASILKVEEGINTVVKNGYVEVDGTDDTARKTFLMMNGTLLLRPSAEKVMENYLQIKINGSLLCEKALVTESFFEQSLSLFDENTDILVIPDGFSLLPDHMELNEFTLARLGNKLFRNGDLYITEKNMPLLPSLESLKVTGTIFLPEKFSGEFLKYD